MSLCSRDPFGHSRNSPLLSHFVCAAASLAFLKRSAGYAFIEFDHERDLKNAYKQGDGKKIDGSLEEFIKPPVLPGWEKTDSEQPI